MSVGRAIHNGAARRSSSEWQRILTDRDLWRAEALELERALAAVTAELADAMALVAQLDRRKGPRRVTEAAWVLVRLRQNYGRRHDDTCNLKTCQCGEWDPETKRYEAAL